MSKFSIIDVETTGLDASSQRIIEIGIIKVENDHVVERYQQLVNPERPIPYFIEQHTGISSDMLQDAPTFSQIVDKVQELLAGGIFVAHNASFDYSFIQSEYQREGLSYLAPRLCTVRLSRRLFPAYRHHGLDSIIRRFNIACPSRHRALDDAEVVWEFLKIINAKLPVPIEQLTY